MDGVKRSLGSWIVLLAFIGIVYFCIVRSDQNPKAPLGFFVFCLTIFALFGALWLRMVTPRELRGLIDSSAKLLDKRKSHPQLPLPRTENDPEA